MFAEYETLRDEVKQTSKRDPSYRKKSQELKAIEGKLSEAHRRFHQHIKDHGCR